MKQFYHNQVDTDIQSTDILILRYWYADTDILIYNQVDTEKIQPAVTNHIIFM